MRILRHAVFAVLIACAPDAPGRVGARGVAAIADSATRPRGAGAAVLHESPEWMPMAGITIGRHVFLKRSQTSDMSLGHELVHVRQQAAHPVWFWISYLALPSWRVRWEAEAYAVQARAGCPIEGEHGLAAYLSGPAYLWPSSRATAERELRRFAGVPELRAAADSPSGPGRGGGGGRSPRRPRAPRRA